jgi:hypothetical protein
MVPERRSTSIWIERGGLRDSQVLPGRPKYMEGLTVSPEQPHGEAWHKGHSEDDAMDARDLPIHDGLCPEDPT